MTGAILAILGSFTFGLGRIVIRRGVIKTDPTIGVIISIYSAVPFFLIVLIAMGRINDIISFPWQSYVWLSLAGLSHLAAGRTLSYLATQKLGANIFGVITKIAPIISVAISVSVLGELLTWEIALGVFLIVFGVTAVSWNPRLFNRSAHPLSSLHSRGVLYALGAGFFFGISPVFVKMGLYGTLSTVAATSISYIAAAIAMSLLLFGRVKRTTLFDVGNKALILFSLVGLITGISHLLRYTALSMAPITVVSPLFATTPIFIVGLSFLFNRKIEVFNVAVIIGVIVVAAGAILLV